ncbi:unnamed protein product [Effrenium voratum]|nr:unnamed protein product [Effrenium voratum]
MISLELPWGADKAIQCFGRVHRANQLVPPKFLVLTTPLGGEVRFNSAIARRMKLLGAVTKGDRMTSMGGVADSHMTDFDVNNAYGQKALMTFYTDTAKFSSVAPELLALYEALPFIGAEGDGEASGRWPTWQEFVEEVNTAWDVTRLTDEIEVMLEDSNGRTWAEMGTKESQVINRFFNRILMLEVHIQNAMFETFFAVYTELVRVDKANGVYDEGIASPGGRSRLHPGEGVPFSWAAPVARAPPGSRAGAAASSQRGAQTVELSPAGLRGARPISRATSSRTASRESMAQMRSWKQ